MSEWAGGKGSSARAVDTDKFNANWDLIWGKKEKTMTKDEILEVVRKNVATITFTKVNGDVRILKGTLIESYLPVREIDPDDVEIETIVEKQERKTNDNVVVVFDVENDGYRSFRVDSVTSVEIIEN